MRPSVSSISTNSTALAASKVKPFILLIALVCFCTACGRTGSTAEERQVKQQEEFHADNDIAMAVKSLADALRVGEPLDSVNYDFEGVLTDGQGAPLYTDVQGSPGVWEINVLSPAKVVIRNVYLGDLLPTDLESYLLNSLEITYADSVPHYDEDVINDCETDVRIYKFGGGYMSFEVRAGISPNGLEGPLLNIVLSSNPPEGA